MTNKHHDKDEQHDTLISPFLSPDYVRQSAQLVGLTIADESMAAVIDNAVRLHAVADYVAAFPLPDTLEAAPRFEP